MLEKLLVFSLKIEDLTFLTLICLSTEGKVKNSSHLFRKLRFAKIRHIGDYFADCGCKIEGNFTDFRMGFWWLDKGSNHVCFVSRISVSFAAKRESQQLWMTFDFGRAISFLPFLVLL